MADYERSPTAVDPSPWLFVAMCSFSFLVMAVVLPIMVLWQSKKSRHQHGPRFETTDQYAGETDPLLRFASPDRATVSSIFSYDDETRAILRLALPYTVTTVSSEFFSNVCLIMISQYIGTHQVAAYALVHILVDLVDEFLRGPIHACITLCAHAVGAENNKLAGQYMQLSISLYLGLNIPVVYFWSNYMGDTIQILQWVGERTANLAQDFARIYIWSYVFQGVTCAFTQILDVSGRATEGAILRIAPDFCKVVMVWIVLSGGHATLQHVAVISVATSFFGLVLTVSWSYHQGWLQRFLRGLVSSSAATNFKALRLLVATAVPLSWESLLGNAEWTLLTVLASFIGTAEVAAWAIMGNIWDLFFRITTGAGAAAEIRVSLHLGDNHSSLAEISAYKSLAMGFCLATLVSLVFLALRDSVPVWYTDDEALASILRDLIPYMAVANLAMAFGMDAWSLVGAQGKYHLVTWVSFLSSCCTCIPLASVFTFVLRFDLQGLVTAVSVGCVTAGGILAYILLSSDWNAIAKAIVEKNVKEAVREENGTL